MPTAPYRPPLAGTSWDSVYDPRQASVFDSTLEKVVRALATMTGANDPTQVPAALTTVTAPAGPPAGGLAKVIDDLVKKRQAIKAYHGSRHEFDNFDIRKIGTGEGAQVYGPGLYFAENPATADYYKQAGLVDPRDAMEAIIDSAKTYTGDNMQLRGVIKSGLYRHPNLAQFGDTEDIVNDLVRVVRGQEAGGTVSNDAIQAYRRIDKAVGELPKGRMYEVAIKASPDDFLDWDKPLSQQNLAKRIINNAGDGYRGNHTAPMKDSGAPLHDLTGGGTVYPDDVYGPNAVRYYGSGDYAADRALFSKIHAMRGKPDKMVDVWRAVPESVWKRGDPQPTLQHGDWVTISRQYAVDHGDRALRGKYRLIKSSVPARALFTNGDSPYEYGVDLSVMGPLISPDMTGADVVKMMGDKHVELLKQHGIPGIKYLDAGSRSAGEGSRNYVVRDDKIIEILRKWGLLPFAVGVGAQQAQQAEAK